MSSHTDTEHISHVEEPSKQMRRGLKRTHSVAKLEEENSTTPKRPMVAKPETPTKQPQEKWEPGSTSSGETSSWKALDFPESAPQPDRQVSKDAVLCLDGGGIRGFVLIYLLKEIEKTSGKKITDLFDWIVGTSTGGIIAMALAKGMKGILHKHF